MKKLTVLIVVGMLLASCAPATKVPTVVGHTGPLAPIISDMQADLVTSRPQWPGMLNLEDIKTGEFLFETGRFQSTNEDYKYEILIVHEPYQKNGACLYDYIYWFNDLKQDNLVMHTYCADEGLIEYTGDLQGWNPYNHLIKSDRKPLTKDQLDALLSKPTPAPQLPSNNDSYNA